MAGVQPLTQTACIQIPTLSLICTSLSSAVEKEMIIYVPTHTKNQKPVTDKALKRAPGMQHIHVVSWEHYYLIEVIFVQKPPRSLNPVPTNNLGETILCCGRPSYALKRFRSISGLYARCQAHPHSCDIQNVSEHRQISPSVQNRRESLVQIHTRLLPYTKNISFPILHLTSQEGRFEREDKMVSK